MDISGIYPLTATLESKGARPDGSVKQKARVRGHEAYTKRISISHKYALSQRGRGRAHVRFTLTSRSFQVLLAINIEVLVSDTCTLTPCQVLHTLGSRTHASSRKKRVLGTLQSLECDAARGAGHHASASNSNLNLATRHQPSLISSI